MKVKDAMTADVLTVSPEMSLKTAAALMAGYAIGGLPVVDQDGTLLGVVTEADVLLKERAEQPHGLWNMLHRQEAHAVMAKVAARTVGDAMTAPVVTVGPRSSMGVAADLMFEHGVNRLPVVDGDKLVGIISRHDLVQAFARSDAEIERDIRNEALAGLYLTKQFTLTIDNGEVTLRGEIDSTYDAAVLPDLIRRVPGVVNVDSRLRAWDPERGEKVLVAMHRD